MTGAGDWPQLPLAEQARQWEELNPGTLTVLLDRLQAMDRHARRQGWAEIALRLLGMLCALAVTALFVWLAAYLVDHDAPAQAVGIFSAGAATIVVAFLAAARRKGAGK